MSSAPFGTDLPGGSSWGGDLHGRVRVIKGEKKEKKNAFDNTAFSKKK